jgi:serine/threonine protein kinase
VAPDVVAAPEPGRGPLVSSALYQSSIETLLQDLKAGNPVSYWEPTNIAIMICGFVCGMNYLHKKGFVHAELKPSDLVLDENYHLHITEIATHELEQAGIVISTQVIPPAYAAPEIYSYDEINMANADTKDLGKFQKADIFPVGVIMYEMLTGKRAFSPEKSAAELRRQTMGEERPKLPATVHEKVSKIIDRCWDKDQTKRPEIGEVLHELMSIEFKVFEGVDSARVMELATQWSQVD